MDTSLLFKTFGRECLRWASALTIIAIGMTCAACSSLGPRQLPLDRFDYNSAIASSANEQMLLNLVRLRFGEVPTFLAVNSVITQYVYTGEAGVVGSSGDSLGFPAWNVGGFANARYIERPTVTYAPLSGQEFAAQLISPVRADVVFSLVSSGWPPVQLLSMTLQRINDIENTGFSSPQATPSDFSRIVELIVSLASRDGLELVRAPTPEREELFLELSQDPDVQTQALVREFKEKLGLEPGRSRFRVTRKIVGRGPDEITIRMHSLLELMGLLSAGVEHPSETPRSDGAVAPIAVHRQRELPVEAFVAVHYRGDWFSLTSSDEQSKRAFGLLIYLFQMQASQNPGAGPILTVPLG